MSENTSSASRGRRGSKRRQGRANSSLYWLIGIAAAIVALGVGSFLLSGAMRNASVPASAATTESVRRVSPQQARALVDAGDAMLYDTRSAAAYEQEHAAGAASLPITEVEAHLDELPRDKMLILY